MTTTHDEIMGLRRELFRDDVYRAARTFHDGQLWLDVGCHIGLFTTLAEAHGALVAGGVDADPLMATAYMDRHQQPALTLTVESVEDVFEAVHHVAHDAAQHVNALKLDVQGAEVPILTSPRAAALLSAQFNTLLFEYHDPATLIVAVNELRRVGYGIGFIDGATDALTGEPTHIVHLIAGAPGNAEPA